MEHGLIENNEGESMEANDLSHNFADQSGSTCIVWIPNVTNAFTKPNPSRGIWSCCANKRRAKNNWIILMMHFAENS